MKCLDLQFRLGVFDPPQSSPYASLGPKDVNTEASKVRIDRITFVYHFEFIVKE
jgi:hypothetical protein